MDTKEMNLQLRTHTALANDILIPSSHKKWLIAAHNSSSRGFHHLTDLWEPALTHIPTGRWYIRDTQTQLKNKLKCGKSLTYNECVNLREQSHFFILTKGGL